MQDDKHKSRREAKENDKNKIYNPSKENSVIPNLLTQRSRDDLNAVYQIGSLGLTSQDKVYEIVHKAMDGYIRQIEDPNISEETRKDLNDRLERMVETSYKKDSEFKGWAVAVIGTGLGLTALAMAGKKPEVRETIVKLLSQDKSIDE